VEVRIGTGKGTCYIGHNRLRINPDGTVTMMWSNPTRIPTSPVDPTVGVLRIDRLDGTPLAILVNYACHPVVIMANLRQYSADFPGVMCRTVEQAFEDRPLCFFLNGAAGDIDSYYTGVPAEQDPVAKMQWTGERLGREAARVAKAIHTEIMTVPSIDYKEDLINFHFRWNPEKYRQLFITDISSRPFEYYFPDTESTQNLPLTTLLIDKRIAMMGVPGEAFVEFQMNWRDRCPVQDCFFRGYANGFFSYFPTIRARDRGRTRREQRVVAY
jgi:neutral ceramidase